MEEEVIVFERRFVLNYIKAFLFSTSHVPCIRHCNSAQMNPEQYASATTFRANKAEKSSSSSKPFSSTFNRTYIANNGRQKTKSERGKK